jgi:hypothetical protein
MAHGFVEVDGLGHRFSGFRPEFTAETVAGSPWRDTVVDRRYLLTVPVAPEGAAGGAVEHVGAHMGLASDLGKIVRLVMD